MLAISLTCLAVLAVLVLNEWWWRSRTHGEISRKAVHISVGTFVALWPFYLSWRQIELLSLAFVTGVLVSRWLNLFRAIHSVQRPTWGEVFFGAAVGLVAVTTHNPAIYAVSLLHMSLADGLAAIVGVKFGAPWAYRVFGARKTLPGTMTFFAVSLAILVVYCLHVPVAFGWWVIMATVGATVIENLAVRGLDNLLIPIWVALLLSRAG